MRIPIGKMDRCITVQKETSTRGTDGSFKKVWTKLADLRAGYNWKSGNERFEVDQEQAVRNVTWVIRYNSAIDERCRVVRGSDTFDIVSVEEIGRKAYMRLYCVKKTVYQEQ